MLIRVFHARVQPGMQAEYERFVCETTLPLLQQLPGLVALHFGMPREETPDAFVMVSIWKDLASLQTLPARTGARWLSCQERHTFLRRPLFTIMRRWKSLAMEAAISKGA
jgi:hypothetical protein